MSVLESVPQSTTQLVDNTRNKKQSIKHHSKGEKTKEKILLSAIELLAINGIKGTTHRAIASHAQLQLSLTTYYFKDIQELIEQAFKLNSSLILSRADNTLETAFLFITTISKKELRKKAIKEELCGRLSAMTASYLINNIKHQGVSLAVEQLMFTKAQISPSLRILAKKHGLALLVPFEQLCLFFNKLDPELDAKIMHTIFSQLQYSQLAKHPDIDVEIITKTTHKIIAWIMGL